MGNKISTVGDDVKRQGEGSGANSRAADVYKLVDLKGGGELVEMMKRARWTKNFKEIDDTIQEKIKPFLYDGGRGKKIPISEVIDQRNKARSSTIKSASKDKQKRAHEQALLDMKFQDSEGNYLHNKPDEFMQDRKFRECCWDINQTGSVGETVLHLCLLNATAIHADLAKRLIQAFPKMINDIYLADEYFGESILHIAIVNEDPAMVKFLLDNGADVHERACGNFFCPDDQKSSRMDTYDHEWVYVTEKTNYEGHVYLGEYPLSFAACLGQEECVRLLIAKGANPNFQDSNGNTVMHMLVIHDRKYASKQIELEKCPQDMFNLLVDFGARLDIKNRQGLTPLTLAAKLTRKEMYEHILEKIRQVVWIYGNVTCAGYPLTDIDTIAESGEINRNSVLNLVVYGTEDGHLDMMDGLIVELLKDKWKTFVGHRFYRRFAIFFAYFIIFMFAFILRPGSDLCPATVSVSGNSTTQSSQHTAENDSCYLIKACRTEDKVRFGLEVLVLIGSVWYIFIAMKEIYHQGFRVFFITLKGAPAKAMFLLADVLVVLMLPGRALCQHEYEDIIAVFAILFTAPYFLFFCRGFKIVGPFVVMIYNMIAGDLLRWIIIYLVFIIGFSQAFFIAFVNGSCDPESNPCVFLSPIESIVGMFAMNVGEFEDIYGTFDYSEYPTFIKIIFMIYMIMVTLLLVNMLIAMMGNTYQLVNETQKEWFRQWAKIVLVVEQSVSTEIRSEQRQKYSQPSADGDRIFVVRWHQTEKEQEEMARQKEEIYQKQRKAAAEKKKNVFRKMSTPMVIDTREAEEGHVNM
ncbi:transient receptor potential cation channel subfamily V member 5-like isoform X1 [Crassostrea virginica]|uniref:Transient receptor potential cation channel subfamily V member 5-like isoform X4 n=1 Tax=Crassostrea virginica TaxID=6565 RepID=A0A8B8D1N8_CRAVI|nr:transient receptor potential cation channel subfamily V member 5-like isoform X4 [Crassostrea virginica]